MMVDITAWLKCQNIVVPKDWIEACIQWLESENRNTKDVALVKKLIFEQWLLTDLTDLRQPVLPREITKDVFTLNGNYCLQINHLTDVSQPKYSQLQEIQNKQNANNFVTADTQFTQKPWEAKPTRMLMLNLTDGVIEVSAMEYHSIPKLNKKISPGTKIRIRGPVTCRRGVLMLNQGNVEILGGIVEDLIETNSYEAVLCRGLGKPLPQTSSPPDEGESISDDILDEIIADVDFDDNQDSIPTSSSRNENQKNHKVSQNINIVEDIADSDLDMFFADAEIDEEQDFYPKKCEKRTIASDSKGNSKNVDQNRAGGESCYTRPSSSKIVTLKSEKTLLQDSKLDPVSCAIPNRRNEFALPRKRNDVPKTEKNIATPFPVAEMQKKEKGCLGIVNKATEHRTFCGEMKTPNINSNTCITSTKKVNDQSANRATGVKNCLCLAKQTIQLKPSGASLMVRVKAIVITLLSKLKSDPMSGWGLQARICDGTEMLDVDFSNKVLENLIGFTVVDAGKIKLEPRETLNRNKLRDGIENCRETIIMMCHYMTVQIRKSTNGIGGAVTNIEF